VKFQDILILDHMAALQHASFQIVIIGDLWVSCIVLERSTVLFSSANLPAETGRRVLE
jgi:hypothetical protein